MNTKEVSKALRRFAVSNRVRLTSYARRESQIRELGSMLLAVTHDERLGYTIEPVNAADGEVPSQPELEGKTMELFMVADL